jgi:hypothetical protein
LGFGIWDLGFKNQQESMWKLPMIKMMWFIFPLLLIILAIAMKVLFNRNQKKAGALMLVLMLVLTIIFFGFGGEKRYYNYYYSVKIEPADYLEYEIYLPLAADMKNQEHEMMDDIEIEEEEDVDVEIIQAVYGKALRIKGSGKVEIFTEAIDADTTFFGEPMEYMEEFKLSMFDHTEPGHTFVWFYINMSDDTAIDIILNIGLEKGSSSGKIISMPWEEDVDKTTELIDFTVIKSGWKMVSSRIDDHSSD